jgi:formate dehydrogenase subunit delta
MTSSTGKLVRMANDIAHFFRAQGQADPAQGVADHLRAFWTVQMRHDLVTYVREGGQELEPVALAAAQQLMAEQI